MTTTTETVVGLTSLDLKALRQADTVSFHHHNGQSSIRASKRIRNPGPFDAPEKDYEFNVYAEFYGKHVNGFSAETAACFAMEHGCNYSEEWRTIVSFLKSGDVLSLVWSADAGSNNYLENSRVVEGHGKGERLYADRLYLGIKRGDKQFKFFLQSQICPDNTARMIKRR